MSEHNQVSRSLLTPMKFLERTAEVYSDKVAVIDDRRRITYAEFASRVYCLASALQSRGLAVGDRVAILSPNAQAMLEAHFGIPLIGGVLVAINTRLAADEIVFILDHSGARYLLVDTRLAPLVESISNLPADLERIITIDAAIGGNAEAGAAGGAAAGEADVAADATVEVERYEDLLSLGRSDPIEARVDDEEQMISINYTSGTTGRPKGVMYSHRGAYLNAVGEIVEMQLSYESVYLWTLPMFHCNGWCFPWAVTAVGATHVCLPKIDPAVVWDLIEREEVSHFNGAPVVISALLNHSARPQRLDRPLTIAVAAAPPSPTLIEQMRQLNAKVVHVYGLTETYGPHTVCAPQPAWEALTADEKARLFARQGVSYAVTEPVRVVDEAMNDVPADGKTMGEVVMRGNNVMQGYFNDPEATAKAFRGGWFHSGDLAVLHPDGYIELRDRNKDVIISGGENISSIEVEQVLYRHPKVLEVAVIGIPHEKWGETPKAFVTLRRKARVGEQELIDFCREYLAHFKCPTAIEFTELPKTSTGKIQKFVLREKEWGNDSTRIRGA